MSMIAPAKPGKPISEIERKILAPQDVDKLGEAVLSLAREVWVLTDRQMILEQVLADAGVDVREAVDKYQPDDALAGKLAQRRQAMIGEILRTFGTGIPEGVTQSSKFGD